MTETEVRQLLDITEFVVEATDCERHYLWLDHSDESVWGSKKEKRYRWNQHSQGRMFTVGEMRHKRERFPVNICCWWASIGGVMVMFYSDMSRIVDHRMIEDWRKENCDKPHTNAMNFHIALQYIDGKTK